MSPTGTQSRLSSCSAGKIRELVTVGRPSCRRRAPRRCAQSFDVGPRLGCHESREENHDDQVRDDAEGRAEKSESPAEELAAAAGEKSACLRHADRASAELGLLQALLHRLQDLGNAVHELHRFKRDAAAEEHAADA